MALMLDRPALQCREPQIARFRIRELINERIAKPLPTYERRPRRTSCTSQRNRCCAKHPRPERSSCRCLMPSRRCLTEKKECLLAKRTVEKQTMVPSLMSSSMQTLRAQDRVAADFESAADDHLVSAGSVDDRPSSSCTVS
ncbi:hypothetical protein EGR_09934 [Echinococcus granulosus]|uniref:Uncharacterized protein n=1 Tax=Echinococcus granulosus TaxID=6210 RepID=W6U282_ECHGR|nr:hypothetical protein EGR_09934 [Echinococcus granulosus]EUB55215.1 hypothetical protein EGR_09934 [Echinococcus granulosus]